MKNKLLCMIIAGSMIISLCACGNKEQKKTVTSASVMDESVDQETDISDVDVASDSDYTGGNPWINSDIEENVRNNYDVDLKDDFALAINKDWILDNPLKSGKVCNDYLASFEDELMVRLKGIATDVSDETNHDAVLVSTYYNAFLDWETRDAAGVDPLLPYLERINNIESIDDLYAYSASTEMTFSDVYGWSFFVSPEDSTLQIVYLYSPSIFLNDAADYENLDGLDDYTQLTYDCAKQKVSSVLSKCGYSDDEIDEIFDGAIQFEKLFSQYCYTNDESYLTETTEIINSQLYTTEELSQFEGFDAYLQSLDNWGVTDVPQFQLYEKLDYFQHFNDIYNEDNLDIIKDYLLAHAASNAMSMLDKELFYENLDIVNVLNGSTGYKDEEEYAINNVSAALGWPLSKLYCERYVSEEDKQNVYNVISDAINEYKLMLSEEEFLSEETKENAINKLDNMIIKCMYPDEWYDYSELELTGSYLDMCLAISNFEINRSVKEFHDPVDRNDWTCTPITINAFYNSTENSINILPGLVGDVLYNDDMEKEEIYAMLGSVIGHEISHGFDPNGAMYDEIGNYSDWWTEEDHEAFDALTDKLVAYYDNITVWDGFNCNGELVKGEACADMAGVACMLRIASNDPDFDYDLFFRSYAKLWASNSAANFEYYIGSYDEHPLNYLRVNVVLAQFDEFYETYDITEGDGMYIAPEDRVKIW